MAIDRPFRLALLTAAGAFSASCWILAAVSLSAIFEPVWNLIGSFQSHLHNLGIAGHGHSHLKGMSRAFRCLWQGQIDQAISYNHCSLYLFSLMIFGCLAMPLIIKNAKN